MVNNPDIKYLFEPRSVAVIGASSKPGKIGYQVVDNIVGGAYRGGIYPVNPKGGAVLGQKVYKSITEIKGDVDAAVITIPANIVFDEVKNCAKKGVKYLIIITSGFSEVGNTQEEKEIVAYAREHGMRILGPNIFGIYSSSIHLNATFGPKDIKPGNVAIITQSGAIGVAMIGKTKVENIGLSSIISVGNKADIDEADLLEYLTSHKKTKIILMYIEGIHHGERLLGLLKKAARVKPIVVIKSGRSKRGAMAAASHTGSLAGADEVFDDVASQCGVIRAESIGEALNWCRFFEDAPMPRGESTVIVTNGGGVGVLAADACEKYKVNLYDDAPKLKEAFSDVMPGFGSAKNPVDITGEATAEDYGRALKVVLKRPDISSVICLGCETAVFKADDFASIVREQYNNYKSKKPIVFSVFGGEEIEKNVARLRKEGVPILSDVYEAVSCLGSLYRHYRTVRSPIGKAAHADVDIASIEKIIKKVRLEKRNFLLAFEAGEVMRAAGITIPKSHIARTLDSAVKYAEEIGYPVVMKVVSKDIIHKSDAGGVALDLENKGEVLDAYESIIHNCRAYKRDAVIEGVEVAEMVRSGIETIVGARRDTSFGPVVMFGLGGIYVEVMKDVSFRAYPLARSEVMDMISDIKSYPLLLGVRGEGKKDINAVANSIIKVGAILKQCKDISDIEVNPLVVYDHGDGVKAVDVRILLKQAPSLDGRGRGG